MTRTIRNWLIIAVILILVGVLVIFGTLALNHWDLSVLGSAELTSETVRISEDFRDISINTDTEDIVFVLSGDGQCRIDFIEPEETSFSAEVRNGVLEITSKNESKWYGRLSLFTAVDPRVTVYLPQAVYGSLAVKEATGDILIPRDFSFRDIEIDASTGDVECGASVSGKLQIGLDTGDIRIGKISAGEIALTVSTGRVEIEAANCKGDLTVNVSTGKAVLKNTVCRSFASNGSTGDLELINLIADARMSVVRSTGDVKLDACDAAELMIKTDTGDVKGTLLSEKIFLVQTDTGSVDVPRTTAGGTCEITTDTGDIDISVK